MNRRVKDCFEESYEEVQREIAEKLIQSGMSLEQVSQITKLPLESLDSLEDSIYSALRSIF